MRFRPPIEIDIGSPHCLDRIVTVMHENNIQISDTFCYHWVPISDFFIIIIVAVSPSCLPLLVEAPYERAVERNDACRVILALARRLFSHVGWRRYRWWTPTLTWSPLLCCRRPRLTTLRVVRVLLTSALRQSWSGRTPSPSLTSLKLYFCWTIGAGSV